MGYVFALTTCPPEFSYAQLPTLCILRFGGGHCGRLHRFRRVGLRLRAAEKSGSRLALDEAKHGSGLPPGGSQLDSLSTTRKAQPRPGSRWYPGGGVDGALRANAGGISRRMGFGHRSMLLRDQTALVVTSHPGRMSPSTAFSFLLISLGLLAAFNPAKRSLLPLVQAAGATALAIAGFALFGYGADLWLDTSGGVTRAWRCTLRRRLRCWVAGCWRWRGCWVRSRGLLIVG